MARSPVNNRLVLRMLLCCGLLWACAGCQKSANDQAKKSKFEIDKEFQRGPLTVHVRADKAKMTIAETVLLELEAAIEPGYEVRMPKVDKVLEHFGIVDWDSLGDKLDPNNRTVSRYQYRLEPFLSGTFPIPALTFEFYDVNSPEKKKYELTTEPVDIEVTSLLGQQRAELKIEDIEGVVEMPRQASFWWVWVLGVLAAAGAEVLTAPDKERLGEFLTHCDLVKFAKYNPTTEQIQKTFDLVKNFIEKTKSEDRKVDVTERAGSEETVEAGSA